MVTYTDVIDDRVIIRTFDQGVSDDELIWHRDKKHRFVEIVEGNGWKLQLDNKIPRDLKVGKKFFIPSMVYHRILKGSTKLTVKIQELECP